MLFLLCIAVLFGKERVIKELAVSQLEQQVSDGDEVHCMGTVYRIEIKSDYQAVCLKSNLIQKTDSYYESGKSKIEAEKLLVYMDSDIQLNIGNQIEVTGEVAFFEEPRNPGNFNQKMYYARQNIHAMIWADKVTISDTHVDHFQNLLYRLRKKWNGMLIDTAGQENGGILSAMLLGEKQEVDTDLKKLYQVSGIGHILAVSGLHLSLIGLGLYRILRRLTGSYPVGGLAGMFFIVSYIMMIGFTVSAVRALIMFCMRVGADITGRKYDPPTALGLAAVVTLFKSPLYLYDSGFWMSYGSVSGILLILPILERLPFLKFMEEHKVKGTKVLRSLYASISILLILIPIQLYCYFEISPYSVLLNLYVIPLMTVIMVSAVAGSMLLLFTTKLAGYAFGVSSLCLKIYRLSCEYVLRLPHARIVFGQPEMWQIVGYYLLLVLAGLMILKGPQMKNAHKHLERWSSWGMLIAVCALFFLTYRFGERDVFRFTMLDVGQGDGLYMKTPGGLHLFVDGGSSDVSEVGKYRLLPFLESQGAGEIDYAFITHGDSDHMNGMEELIQCQKTGIKIRVLVLPDRKFWDETLTELAVEAEENGTKLAVMEEGDRICEGDFTLTCIQPGSDDQTETGNASSMVLLASYHDYDILLTGDVEGEGEENLTKRISEEYKDKTIEVLKVAHHGSKNSSCEEFLEMVHPDVALISAGINSRYGHPHKETLERLSACGAKIISTQDEGAITLRMK